MNFGIKTILSAVIIAFVSAFFGYVSGTRTGITTENKAEVRQAAIPQHERTDEHYDTEKASAKHHEVLKKYILRENGGKLSLLLSEPDGKETVYKTYDINVSFLPEADRNKLAEGIATDNLSDALMLVEDYIE